MPEEKPAKDPKEILVFSASVIRSARSAARNSPAPTSSPFAFPGWRDICVTRRARKYSALSAVVVRFSRSGGRYERQGILVEEPALNRAQEECEKDADKRAKAEFQLVVEDKEFTSQMADELRLLFPQATVRSSGRVGRTAGAKSFDEDKLTAAVVVAIRHRHTRYDELLMTGYGRMDPRQRTRADVDEVLERRRSRE